MEKRGKVQSSKVIILHLVLVFTMLDQYRTSETLEDYIVDHKNLIYNYMLVCGDNALCEPSKFSFVIEKRNITTSVCPNCACDSNCVRQGNCCPDVIFSVPEPKCKSTVLLNTYNYPVSALMVDSCQVTADPDLVENCTRNYTIQEGFQNPLVTSTKHMRTFANKYCALCNDVGDFEPWGLNIDCSEFADFNYLSSYEEIVDLARVRHCSIEYTTVFESAQWCNPKHNSFVISALRIHRCNTTGHWQTYDKDIEYACEKSSYSLEYSHYRNIFCFICNPSQRSDPNDVISVCNMTGAWNEYKRDLEIACEKHEITPATFPFKNIYCHLCNSNTSKIGRYTDSSGTVDVFAQRKGSIFALDYSVRIDQHYIDFYKDVLKMTEINVDFPQQVKFKTDINNMTSLLLKHYSLTGTYKYCDDNLTSLIYINDNCLCDVDCFFKGYAKCCVEIAIQYPVSCYFETFLSGPHPAALSPRSKSYSLVDGCPFSETDIKIRQRCENPLNEDIFSMVPIQDDHNEIIYRNFDCFICNQMEITREDDLSLLSSYNYIPWSLGLFCTTDLNTDFHVVLGDVIKLAKERGCLIRVYPEEQKSNMVISSREHCEITRKMYTIDRCNVTGSWEEYDSDIVQACENTGPFLPETHSWSFSTKNPVYKNAFCSLCNPSPDVPPLPLGESLTTCNTSADELFFGPSIIDACESFPTVPNVFPFKNLFCQLCEQNAPFPLGRGIGRPRLESTFTHRMAVKDAFGTDLRDLFSTNRQQVVDSRQVDLMFGEIKDFKLYDSLVGKYRPLTCYPGKMLVNDKCVPLLTETGKLRYSLAASIETKFKQSILLTDLMNIMKKEIVRTINTTTIIFNNFHLVSNSSCVLNFSDSKEVPVRLYVHTDFLIESEVHRLHTEEKLLRMRNMTIEFFNTTLQLKRDSYAFLLPSLVYKLNVNRQCILTHQDGYHYHSPVTYRTTIVSDLLLCQQIELNETEFKFDKSKFEIIVENGHINLKYDEFFITAEGKARVCVDDFKRIMSHSSTQTAPLLNAEMKTALRITNFICTIVSLACLLATFVTYSIFSTLRSIPGMNNMCLVFAMFFAQILLQFGLNQTSDRLVCEFIGVFSHFFWLSTFGCMSVCSFHMFNVFTNTMQARNITENWKKTMLLYVLYAYGISALIVVFNIIIIYQTTETSIGYGDMRCFISHNASFYVTFLSPVVIVCFTNIYFFIKTALEIKSHPTVDSTKANRNEFLIYVKLFSITGITWLLLVLDTLFPLTVFSFIVIIFNASQGVFIFISFICNKRVLSLYKNIGRASKKTSSMTSTSKSSSGVSKSTVVSSSAL